VAENDQMLFFLISFEQKFIVPFLWGVIYST